MANNNPFYKERPSCKLVVTGAAIRASTLVMVHSTNGTGHKAADSAGYRVAGIAQSDGAVGDTIAVNADIGCFANSTTALAQKDVGGLAYVEDENTVTTYAGSTNKLVAGKVVHVSTEGVYVDTNIQSVASVSAPVT